MRKSFQSQEDDNIRVNDVPARISYTAGYMSITMLGNSSMNPTVCDSGISFSEKKRFGSDCREGGRCAEGLTSSGKKHFYWLDCIRSDSIASLVGLDAFEIKKSKKQD